MPLLSSAFKAPWLLRNGHVQTILPALVRRSPRLTLRPERLELPDGDFLDMWWTGSGAPKLVIISHGLEGSSDAAYIRGMAAACNQAGWEALTWNFRGCGEENRLAKFYHSGATEDLSHIVSLAARRYECIALAGFSLGGNLTLKYLGESTPPACIVAGAAISAPVDLAACAAKLDRDPANRLYLRRFMKTLVEKIESKARRFPGQINTEGLHAITTFREFDDRYTAILHGFRDAADYWARSSSRQYLTNIDRPALLVNARNDPFLAEECFPFAEANSSKCFFFEAPESGGHVGFLDLKEGLRPWYERRVTSFLNSLT